MQKYLFFPFPALLLALFIAVGCERPDGPQPSGSDGTTTVPGAESGTDGPVGFRTCGAATDCDVLITIVSGTGGFTVCGVSSGSTACVATNSCGSSNGFSVTFPVLTTSASVCITKGEVFNITNNDPNNALRVEVSSSGGGTGVITIAASDTEGFEVDANCKANYCP